MQKIKRDRMRLILCNETAGALSFTGGAIRFRAAESAGSEVRSLVGRANVDSRQELT